LFALYKDNLIKLPKGSFFLALRFKASCIKYLRRLE
jgi:hypothetical protein